MGLVLNLEKRDPEIWYIDRLSSKMEYVGPIGTPRGHHQKNLFVTYEAQVQFVILKCLKSLLGPKTLFLRVTL